MNRRPCSRSVAGLTLVEVTVAIALLGLVAVAAVTATGAGLQAWLAARETTALDRRSHIWNDRIHAAVASMIPMAALSGPAGNPVQVFFQGTPQGMRFVTGHAPFNGGRGGVRLVEIRSEYRSGQTSLVLRDAPCPDAITLGALLEAPMGSSLGTQPTPPLEAGSGRVWSGVVAGGLAECEFRYLAAPVRSVDTAKWISRWDDREALPRAVRIAWNHEAAELRDSITAAVMGGTRGSRNLAARERDRVGGQ